MLIRMSGKSVCPECSKEQLRKASFMMCLLKVLKPEDYSKAILKYKELDSLINNRLCTKLLSTFPESNPIL